jgi:protein-S-isoprenylcysteine O-methyltransferase Ste14
MKCRQCGTEIADKALVCYRCGTATTEARYKAPIRKRKSSVNLIVSVLALILVVLFAFYLQQAATVGAPNWLRWLIAVAAVAIVAFRLTVRRRR